MFRITDIEVKKLLNTYLQFLRDRYYLDVYMWKAEVQERGNIHFHIIINKFVWANYLTNAWNRILKRNGLNTSKNCVDIHSIRKIKNLKKYFSKYMTKNETTRRPVNGKIWATSEYVSNYHGITLAMSPAENDQFSKFMSKTTCKRFDASYFHWFECNPLEIEYYVPNTLLIKRYRECMNDKYNIKVAELKDCLKN